MESRPILDVISVPSEHGRPIMDAATGGIVGHAPIHTADDVETAVTAARAAQSTWAARDEAERQKILHTIADDIEAHAEELATILSREQGKPLDGPNARFEIGAAAAWTRNAASVPLETEVILADGDQRAEIHYHPLGVVAAIGPWNWPVMIAVWQTAPALRVGNAVIVKPSEYTPLSVLALAELYNRHLPEGVLTVVAGDRQAGAALAAHADVDKILFTGSTATGRRIVAASANNLARLTLELGGNDPAIVLPDVDIAGIADDLFWGAFINTGQTCAAIKRLYVHTSIYGEVVDALAERARTTPIGPGLVPGNLLGPIQNAKQFDIVSALVDDARQHGARIVAGGQPDTELGRLFYCPTIVADVSDGVRLVDEEQFGPVLPVVEFTDLDDAVERANASPQGLGASVWASDLDAAGRVAERLQAGTVWINRHGVLNPDIPFGGTKDSGYGQEFGSAGLKAVSSPRVIVR